MNSKEKLSRAQEQEPVDLVVALLLANFSDHCKVAQLLELFYCILQYKDKQKTKHLFVCLFDWTIREE